MTELWLALAEVLYRNSGEMAKYNYVAFSKLSKDAQEKYVSMAQAAMEFLNKITRF